MYTHINVLIAQASSFTFSNSKLNIQLPYTDKSKMKASSINRQTKADVTLKGVEKRLHQVCDQMTILYSKIDNLQLRYQRTRHTPDSPLNQSLSMQLNVLKGMYNVYYQYAAKQTEKLMILYGSGLQEVQQC